MKYLLLIFSLLASLTLNSQGLFEESEEMEEENSQPALEINGYMRAAIFNSLGNNDNIGDSRSQYGEAALKLSSSAGEIGDAYAELRYRGGYEFGSNVSSLDLREAYINAYFGFVDFRLGKQIVVWGRADGINPTNNITPQNMMMYSTDEDDRREGNFLLRSYINLEPVRLEFIYVPVYKSSVLPFDRVEMPGNLQITEALHHEAKLKNSSVALKANLELAAFDGSVSYFEGYNIMPSIELNEVVVDESGMSIKISPSPYKLRVLGADFSTTVFGLGLRGEFAYRDPQGGALVENPIGIPKPEFQSVVGLDKSFGDLSLLVQYVNKYVKDYEPLAETVPIEELISREIKSKNMLLNQQLDEMTHSVFFRPAMTFFYETLNVECAAMYNITTDEYMYKPMIKYNLADAFVLSAGYMKYSGPDGTIFNLINESMSTMFVELKKSF